MKIFPAIDLRDGKVVRLLKGDYDKMTVYGEDPVAQARAFEEKGAEFLHAVDLDGARDGDTPNFLSLIHILYGKIDGERIRISGKAALYSEATIYVE